MHDTGSATPMMTATIPLYYPRAASFHYTRVVPLATLGGRTACLLKPTCTLLTGGVMLSAGDHEGERWHIHTGQVPHQHTSARHCGPLSGMPCLPSSFVCPVYVLVSLSCLSVYLSICCSIRLPDCTSACFSACLPSCLSVCLIVCLSICRSVSC